MVSIITPVYNSEKYIRETIDSVLAQSYTDWELILVNDASTDHSAEVIRQIAVQNPQARIILLDQAQNAGAAAARNAGIDAASGRYISFLDADDLWYPDKLEKEMLFMDKHKAGFVFSAYEFGTEKAIPTGKRVRVPQTLTYKEALSRTVIFTSTVLIDTWQIGWPYMPLVESEDTATWWRILKSGVTAYGLDQPLVIYRRPAKSLSSDKKAALRRIWNLYRNEEGLGILRSSREFAFWFFRAVIRRTVDDVIRSHFEAIKRFAVLQLSLLGLVFHTAAYGAAWFRSIYPILRTGIIQHGVSVGVGINLYFRGHILILAIYFFLLVFLSQTADGMRTGYLKRGAIFSSEVIALLLTNIFTYFQVSLIKNWLLPVHPFLLLFAVQCLIAAVWALLSDWIYRLVFPPKEALVINLSGEPGDLLARFETRQDRFRVTKVMTGSGMDRIKKECLRWYECVVINGGTDQERRELLSYCYERFIRVCLVPEVDDLLIQGTEQMDLFDMPILELKEYTIRWETRLIKRIADTLICFPLFLISLFWTVPKGIRKETCMGRNMKPFVKYGIGIRNVLNGTMALVGPEAKEFSLAQQELQENRAAVYRYRIRPGVIGYTQLRRQEDTSSEEQIKNDLYYIQHYSLLNDFRIILQYLGKRSFLP